MSTGQKKRIALARAFLRKSDIYIFDEVTSNLNQNNEEMIINSIIRYTKDSTVIIITHSQNVMEKFNNKYKLDQGKLKKIAI